ncbi:hypothetical protein CAPTEDRAFT_178434 [Capitella teleta]|uniref:Delta-sarcoglycan n=1 Tax=Capitella teleta TaxID=283909 RepID=R7TE37_CAPTE|nr:hypothetical protein CAPTEDRAFT_178434 [Capitella teleta]|eukprot:ELT89316.1 hypothetical protein CAPTEDRAFT_178434 [Capitella teleta]
MGRGRSNDTGDWSQPPNTQIIYKIGIYGWRKRCLYVFLLLLMVTVIVNLALTIWIIKVMDFNLHGMGKLRIHDDKVRVEGTAEFLKAIYTQELSSLPNSPLKLESARNITFNARDPQGTIVNRLYLGHNKLEAYANKFQINGRNGHPLFSADEREVVLGAHRLKVAGSGGVTFKGSVQTPTVSSDIDSLRLESLTRGMYLSAPEGISIEAAGGTVNISSLFDLKLESLSKTIRLDGRNIQLRNIPVSEPGEERENQNIYQVCICKNGGKLFLAPPAGNCHATPDICS